ncbi:ubiquinone biosynthesis O-methyltransferase, mitochondrial-like [Pieris brassicae]|uniref:ubiquinone biosynthesis O-methyltransferase, mitochondrial-like n=1 Tax=Pieris brassicae TaxID=7116 RepID=UPI001E660050|nr:ubiquinone biosynthesis O-methyltransferase, mitochondrial-like [Pieris brassicae]
MREQIVMASSVDIDEVQRHSDLMDSWWSPDGPLWGLQLFNQIRIPFMAEELASSGKNLSSKPLMGKKVLEVGCGGGLVTEEFAKLGAEVTGVDPSPVLINLAKEHSKVDERVAANKPTYLNTTIEEHSKLFPNHYDAVIASEVVEHVANVNVFLESCVAALKPGGKMFITSPTRTRLGQFLVMVLGALMIIPRHLMTYSKFTKPDEISAILEKNKCRVDKVKGLFYLPLINKVFWVFFNTVWYAMAATKQGHAT